MYALYAVVRASIVFCCAVIRESAIAMLDVCDESVDAVLLTATSKTATPCATSSTALATVPTWSARAGTARDTDSTLSNIRSIRRSLTTVVLGAVRCRAPSSPSAIAGSRVWAVVGWMSSTAHSRARPARTVLPHMFAQHKCWCAVRCGFLADCCANMSWMTGLVKSMTQVCARASNQSVHALKHIAPSRLL